MHDDIVNLLLHIKELLTVFFLSMIICLLCNFNNSWQVEKHKITQGELENSKSTKFDKQGINLKSNKIQKQEK